MWRAVWGSRLHGSVVASRGAVDAYRKMERQLEGASYSRPSVEGEKSSRKVYRPAEKSLAPPDATTAPGAMVAMGVAMSWSWSRASALVLDGRCDGTTRSSG